MAINITGTQWILPPFPPLALALTDRPGRRPSEGLLFHSEPEHPDKLQPPPPRRAEAETTVDPFAAATGNPRELEESPRITARYRTNK